MSVTKPSPVRQIDVARKMGLSQRTVSAVLGSSGAKRPQISPETANLVRKVAREMGYQPFRPAQQMKGGRSGMLGVLIGAAEAEVNYRRLSCLERITRDQGYRLLVGHVHSYSQFEEYVDDFQARGIEGLLCLRHELSAKGRPSVYQKLSELNHVVYLDPPSGVEDACYVKLDRADGIAQCVAHLASTGRKRIGIMLDSTKHARPMRDRLLGYRNGLTSIGMLYDDNLVWVSDHPLVSALPEIGSAVEDLVLEHKADAVIASNDEVALSLIKGLRKNNLRTPEDVAVVGYDNLRFSRLVDPELSTVDHRNELIMSSLFSLITSLINAETLTPRQRRVVIKPELTVRQSS